jgi:hypothetical protein
MGGSTFDREGYVREVLEPARRHRIPASQIDLYRRYALHPGLLDDPSRSELEAHLEAVVNLWRTLGQQRRGYADLVSGLLSAHGELARAGDLEPARLRQRRAAGVSEARTQLEARIDRLSARYSCVRPAVLDGLAARFAGRLDRAEVRAELDRRDVRVAEPPELPPTPPASYASLRRCLAVLGRRLSLEVLHDGLLPPGLRVLDGLVVPGVPVPVDGARLAAARRRLAVEPLGDRKTAAETVLAILEEASATRDGLDRLVSWELLEALRARAGEGEDFSQRELAGEAVQLGLAREEADRLALAVHHERDRGRHGTADAARAALAEGDLRAAQRLAATLTAGEAADLHQRLEQEDALVRKLTGRAERALAGGDTEAAAELLAEARRHARDDDAIRGRLHGLPPPPPTQVRARVVGATVSVDWRPSPARAGGIRYRVTRAVEGGRGGTRRRQELGLTGGNEWSDKHPPAGEPLRYWVAASRDEGAWSEEVPAGLVVVTPDVTGLQLVVGDGAVSGSWQMHPSVVEVVVVRSEGMPPSGPAGGRPLRPVDRRGFTDREVRNGVRYYYRVTASYVAADGTRFQSPGVVGSAVPTPPPDPVLDLRASVRFTDGWPSALDLRWTPPVNGQALLLLARDRPPWAQGERLDSDGIDDVGRRLAIPADQLSVGMAQVPLDAEQRRLHLVPVTVLHTQAVAGNPVEVAPALPVRRLEALRLDEVVRLSWVWPDDCAWARVRWWPVHATPDQGHEAECPRRQYKDHGGFEIAAGSEAVVVSVEAVSLRRDGPVRSAPVTREVSAGETKVRCRLRRRRDPGRWWPAQAVMLELTSDRSCVLPPLVVIQSTGLAAPLRADQGRAVAEVERQRLEPGRPLWVPLRALQRGPSWLACFPAPGSEHEGVVLDPQATRL